jgi:predicted Zn-dependent peptidase
VYDTQQAHYAQGQYWELQDAGLFYAIAGVRPDASIDRVEALLLAEIDRVGKGGVTEAEVEKAKRQLEVSLLDGLATTHAIASRIGLDTVVFGRIRPLDERLAAIRAVTPAAVKRVARTYFVDERRSVVRVVPAAVSTEESIR